MTPKNVPTNDLDRALMALGKSKSALPRFIRELVKGELNKGRASRLNKMIASSSPHGPPTIHRRAGRMNPALSLHTPDKNPDDISRCQTLTRVRIRIEGAYGKTPALRGG